MAVCPFATHKLIEPGSNDPRIKPRVAILHVDATGADSLFDYFRARSGGIESHFHIKWTGEIEQYRDTDWQADANYKANPFAVSIETQGFAGGKWNRRQLASIKRLLTWLHDERGIPLQRCPQWDGAGIGYHIQFGAPGAWTPVAKSCPGPQRIDQFDNELVPWMNSNPTTEETEPVRTRDVLDIIRHRITNRRRNKDVGDALRAALDTEKIVKEIRDDVKRLLDAEGN